MRMLVGQLALGSYRLTDCYVDGTKPSRNERPATLPRQWKRCRGMMFVTVELFCIHTSLSFDPFGCVAKKRSTTCLLPR